MNTAYRVWDGEQMHYWDDEELSLEITMNEWILWRDFGDGCRVSVAESHEEGTALMWGTGLKDKNGNMIYEGDILKRTVTVVLIDSGKPPKDIVEYMKVEYREDYAGFFIGERPLLAYVDNTHDVDTGCRCTKPEVIDNINRNPELLEGAE
ncbi:YopX family protein [Bacillus atrophaeus]|uniref:YopX family protein n=1 Tax=Bacillus atrophaeus TaxID=1452 RepID=UPI0030F470FC